MCEVIDSYINQGIEQGITQNSNQTILKLYSKLGSSKQVADLLDLDLYKVETVISNYTS